MKLKFRQQRFKVKGDSIYIGPLDPENSMDPKVSTECFVLSRAIYNYKYMVYDKILYRILI